MSKNTDLSIIDGLEFFTDIEIDYKDYGEFDLDKILEYRTNYNSLGELTAQEEDTVKYAFRLGYAQLFKKYEKNLEDDGSYFWKWWMADLENEKGYQIEIEKQTNLMKYILNCILNLSVYPSDDFNHAKKCARRLVSAIARLATQNDVYAEEISEYYADLPFPYTKKELSQYRKMLVKKHHTDNGGNQEIIAEINRAYDELVLLATKE